MKEFIDKLIGRLEEELIPLNQEITKYFYELKDTDNPKYIYAVGRSNALTDFKYAINELAEEYNGSWIPCSERLPEANMAVLVCTNANQIDVDYYGEYIKDFIGLKGTEQYAIAWQPLPQPYKENENGKI